MEKCLGLLKVRVIRGINLAIRDVKSSDPYVILRMGKHKLKTHTIKNNTNPVWNENLTLRIADPYLPVKLQVYDSDMFIDDKMGDAEFEIRSFIEALGETNSYTPAFGRILNTIKQDSLQNCLAEDSYITLENGKLTQHMFLRLRNVECGEIEIMLEWVG